MMNSYLYYSGNSFETSTLFTEVESYSGELKDWDQGEYVKLGSTHLLRMYSDKRHYLVDLQNRLWREVEAKTTLVCRNWSVEVKGENQIIDAITYHRIQSEWTNYLRR